MINENFVLTKINATTQAEEASGTIEIIVPANIYYEDSIVEVLLGPQNTVTYSNVWARDDYAPWFASCSVIIDGVQRLECIDLATEELNFASNNILDHNGVEPYSNVGGGGETWTPSLAFNNAKQRWSCIYSNITNATTATTMIEDFRLSHFLPHVFTGSKYFIVKNEMTITLVLQSTLANSLITTTGGYNTGTSPYDPANTNTYTPAYVNCRLLMKVEPELKYVQDLSQEISCGLQQKFSGEQTSNSFNSIFAVGEDVICDRICLSFRDADITTYNTLVGFDNIRSERSTAAEQAAFQGEIIKNGFQILSNELGLEDFLNQLELGKEYNQRFWNNAYVEYREVHSNVSITVNVTLQNTTAALDCYVFYRYLVATQQ